MDTAADLVVLSPHLDDGVFSCGGGIANTIARGGKATIVTFFAGQPELEEVPRSLRKFCNYAVRKAEDQRAAHILGADVEWLDFVERAFVPPALSGLTGVFRTPNTGLAGLRYLNAMKSVVMNLLQNHPKATFLAPLAVGNHIDHVEVFAACISLCVECPAAAERIMFYEDAYALGSRARQQHFVTRQRPWQRDEAPDKGSLRSRGMFAALAMARRGPPLEQFAPAEVAFWQWRCVPERITDSEACKLEAVCAYASQVAMLGGPEAWCARLQAYHRCFDVAEPRWRPLAPDVSRFREQFQ